MSHQIQSLLSKSEVKKKKISLERLNSGYAEAEILMKLKTGQLD